MDTLKNDTEKIIKIIDPMDTLKNDTEKIMKIIDVAKWPVNRNVMRVLSYIKGLYVNL